MRRRRVAWGTMSEEREAHSLEIVRTAARFIEVNDKPGPFGPVIPGHEPLPCVRRPARAAGPAPVIRGPASTGRPQAGHHPGLLGHCSGA